jgi:phage replication-related protein YjqB (UPF0714/DUF867 family)
MAYHGGGLEHLTDVIAQQAAEQSDSSYYGVHQPQGLKWHVPSHEVSPKFSNSLKSFIEHVDVVITVHGFGRDGFFTSLLLGGRNRHLAGHLSTHLVQALPDYEICHDLETIPVDLRGLHENNPVNLPRLAGVQIELPPRVRGVGRFWKDWQGEGLTPHTQALIGALTATAKTWQPAKQ